MGKPRSSKSAGTDFDEYVTRRISELGLPTNLKDIRTAATQFENVVASVERQASGLLVVAAICFGFILYTVARVPELSAGEALSIALAGAPELLCVIVGTRLKTWKYSLRWWGWPRAVKFRQQSNTDAVLHEVNAGNHSIMRLATSGVGLLASTVAQELLHLFDKTPDIYPDERIKRLKVRIALQVIIDLASTNAEVPSPRSLNGSNVVKKFSSTLKFEASRLLQAGEINDLEERLLCRVNITGDDTSFDPAAEGKKHTKKPHSWFLDL